MGSGRAADSRHPRRSRRGRRYVPEHGQANRSHLLGITLTAVLMCGTIAASPYAIHAVTSQNHATSSQATAPPTAATTTPAIRHPAAVVHATPTTTAAPTTAAPTTAPTTPAATSRTPLVTYTYSIRARGPIRSNPATLATLAKQAYADPRGWSLGGRIAFVQVASGGNFTLWLATADLVPSFGVPCDTTYSCRAGWNVVANEARWINGSPTGVLKGNLTEYRLMIINHETGHWLGLHHRNCPKVGGPAPLMEQQSVDLQGCLPNAWPTQTEIDAVAATHLS